MANDPKPTDTNKALLMHLVMMLGSSAMHQMGKLVNPESGKAEADFEAAGFTIDLLNMIEDKTRGNLDAEEARFLKDTLASLQLSFVQAKDSAPAGAPAPAPAPGAPAAGDRAATEPPEAPSAPTPKKGNDREPKYHKSYGS